MIASWLAVAQGGGVQAEETFRFLSAPPAWVVGLVLLPLLALFTWWSYCGLERLEPRVRWTLSVGRGIAVALCLLALFRPAFEKVSYTTRRAQVHVLVDDSASMQRKDSYPDARQQQSLQRLGIGADVASLTRAELVQRVLGQAGGLVDQLGQNHDLRLFRFWRKPSPIRDLGELTARGPRTQIGDALDLHLTDSAAQNLDALILVSDGRSNSGLDPVQAARKYAVADVPVFTIGVGDPNPPKNARIAAPPGPREALCKEEIAFDATVSGEGLAGRRVTVTLSGRPEGGTQRPLTTTQVTLGEDGTPVRARLYHAFDEPGNWSLTFAVSSFPDETTLEDNQETRFLRVNDHRIRVLFVDYLPRWDYRYTSVALQRVDPSIEVQVYLFAASKDFPQERSEGLEPLRDIPRTREELFRYHVVLLGDVPPEQIAPTEEKRNEWLKLLVEFVEFGGGLGVQWGELAMPYGYRGAPLEDLLPVVLEDPADLATIPIDRTHGFVPQLEAAMRPHDIVLLKRDPEDNARLWLEGIEPMILYGPVRQAKAGADVVLRHPIDENRYGRRVLAAAGLYPRGRTFFLGVDQMWRLRNPYGEKYYDAFWRNVVRWLAQGRLRRQDDRVDLRLDKVVVDTGEQLRVTLQMQDAEFQPRSGQEATVFLRRADGQAQRRTLPAVSGELGTWQGTWVLDEPGAFSVLVCQDDNPSGEVLAREDVLVRIPDLELRQSTQDPKTLQAVAETSKGGQYCFLGDVGQLAALFAERRPVKDEVDRSTREAWDTIWTLLGILSILAIEWLLRKRARLV